MIYRLKEFVKSYRLIYKIYFYVMSFFINFLKLFVITDDKLILFVSYGGKHYSDSPKEIFEQLRRDNRFCNYKMVWAFVNPRLFEIEGADKIKIDTFKYFRTALKARVWITNVVVERALNFKGKNTFYLCTSHGTPLKEKLKEGDAFKPLAPYHYDKILAQSEIDVKLQMEEFDITLDRIAMIGYPRNDKFTSDLQPIVDRVRSFYHITSDKKIILYAPTYRDWNKGFEKLNLDVDKWERTLGEKFVLLFRAHPTVILENIPEDSIFLRNVTAHEDLDDLLIAADVLISDYSSLFFDYSIMHKPMISWAYDYDEFCKYRKLRIDVTKEVYGGEISEDTLLDVLKKEDFDSAIEKAIAFQKKYVTVNGNAAKSAVDLIATRIMTNDNEESLYCS